MKKGISVIVCCYNSAKRLPETLGHLIRQKTGGLDWEIIVVDNASTDTTTEIAKQILSAAQPPVNYKVIHEPEPGLIHARNRGYDNSSFDFLLFCDDDNWLADAYLQSAHDLMNARERMAILGGCGEAVFEGKKPEWFDAYQVNFAVGDQAPEQVKDNLVQLEKVYGAGFMVRRELFETLKKLEFKSLLSGRKGNQLISGEDSELCWAARQLGYEIWYSRDLRFKHLMTSGRMKWEYLKKLYFGFGRMNVYIHAYKHYRISEQPPNFDLRFPFWLDALFHKLKTLFRFLPKVLFQLSEEGNKDVLRFWGIWGEIYEVWHLKDKYREVYLRIAEYRKRIATVKAKP